MVFKTSEKAFPVLGKKYKPEDYRRIDLSKNNHEIRFSSEFTQDLLKLFIEKHKSQYNIKIPYGGYGEQRFFYELSPLFASSGQFRSIHLGTDLWATPGTPIYAPFNGYIHGFAFNNKPMDYGATIILAHSVDGNSFYSLYGHLSLESLRPLSIGMNVQKGQIICEVGKMEENGGWAPHLHLQLILNIGDHKGDYPGVATQEEAKYMLRNSPDPENLIFGG